MYTNLIKSLHGISRFLWTFTGNTLIIILLMSFISFAIVSPKPVKYYNNYNDLDRLQRSAYSHMQPSDIDDLLANTWDRNLGGWEYEEITGFKEKARTSKFVNVSPIGFRHNDNNTSGDLTLNNKIWMLGGSTTFGYGVSDSETIPAYLQKIGKIDTVNFGRGYYYSKQENLLLQKLLSSGYRPKVVIFLDGINERCGIEAYQKEMHNLFLKVQQPDRWTPMQAIKSIFNPTLELVVSVIKKVGWLPNIEDNKTSSSSRLHKISCNSYGAITSLPQILDINLVERKNVCNQFKVTCKTFIQPFPSIHAATNSKIRQQDIEELREKFDALKSVWRSHNSVFITDSLRDLPTHSFVDEVHYSSDANRVIAKAIFNNIKNSINYEKN